MEAIRPYVVATQGLRSRLRISGAGTPILVDPQCLADAEIMDWIGHLDPVIYGSRGLDLPRWALYDCAAIPGLICGFGIAGRDAPAAVIAAFGDDSRAAAFLPLSRGIAVPTLDPEHWLAYAVAGLGDVVAGVGQDWRLPTLRLLMTLLGVSRYSSATQWRSTQLDVFASVGALRLSASWVPAHSEPASCVFELTREIHGQMELLDIEKDQGLKDLQRRIETGAIVYVVGPRRAEGGTTVVPLAVQQ